MKQKRYIKLIYTVYYAMLIRVVMLAGVGNGLLPRWLFHKLEQPYNQKVTIGYTAVQK